MATNTSICGICSLRQITKTSDHWCVECEEALCNECTDHHKFLKATRSHMPIPISNYESLPSVITDLQQSCVYHTEQYQQYCIEHALPICCKCINDHRKCNVITLENVTENIKTSGQFLDLESRLGDLLQNIDTIKKDRKANLTAIEKKKTQHVKEIKRKRIEINKYLDNLEKQIINNLEEKECQCKEGIQKVLSSLKEKETIIKQCQTNFQSIKQYASDLQIFLGMREFEMKVNESEQYLQSFFFEQVDIVCNLDTSVHIILNSLKNFGSTEIKTRKSNIKFSRAKDKQAQLPVVAVSKPMNHVKLNLQKKIATHGEIIRGCCISRKGDFLFTDNWRKQMLTVLASDGTLKYNMSLDPTDGYDITFVNTKTVAITSGFSEKTGITIINIENRRKIKFVKLQGHTYGITRDRDSLFVCVEGHGICKVNTVDYNTSHVISCNLPGFSYLSIFADKIYYTNTDDHSVVCCNRNGSLVWTFYNKLVLKWPRGITVDNEGQVFVVGASSSNVLIISSDGKHHKEILTVADWLCSPSAIFFDKQKRELLVANAKHTAFLYNVT